MTRYAALARELRETHPGLEVRDTSGHLTIDATADTIPPLATALVARYGLEFATLLVEQTAEPGDYLVHYFFYATEEHAIVEVATKGARGADLPAISDIVHAADWHEREAEDLYGIRFSGHPFLGDFVLHDDKWPEDVAPMRKEFDPGARPPEPGLAERWRPRRLLEEPGALVFPLGPIWGDYAEAGLWLLETPGEQILQAHTRLFYKYRGVEKIAEGQSTSRALLLAERFSGNSAFAHASAYCRALEKLAGCEVPTRARMLRVVFAELERMRYHASTIAQLAGATALVVAKAMAQEIEEKLLRLTAEVCGHRYLFGVAAPGGLAQEPNSAGLNRLAAGTVAAARDLEALETLLLRTSSFLDRLEEVGTLTPELAESYGTVGPIGRASGRELDLRRTLPYGGYGSRPPALASETEGDGFARLRIYFAEIRESARLIQACIDELPGGVTIVPCEPKPGGAFAWVEAPAGAAFHWLRVDERGKVARLRLGTPGFRNWHAFHRAVEGTAFQDFPIILASFGLSVAESDR